MKNHALLLSLLCFAGPLFAEAAIHKCTMDGTTVYQDTPCTAEESRVADDDLEDDMFLAPAITPEPAQTPGDARVPVPAPHRAGPATAVMVGMSDTEVLNLRGWGRPAKITRKKTNGAWLEEWTYFLPTEGRTVLQFANGKLTNVESPVAMAPQPLTQITAR